MLRVVLIMFLTTFMYANDLVQTYLTQGINAVQKELEKRSITQEYWQKFLGDKNVTLGYYQDLDTLLLANKDKKNLKVYTLENGNPRFAEEFKVIVGKDGDKQKEGDLKTPLGVYEIVKKFTPNDPFYGPLAYSLSYPNTFDKVEGKNGYGIWIHGSPLDGSERDPMSKGCIVMKNDTLLSMEKVLNPTKAAILVGQDTILKTNKDEISAILAQFFSWRMSWQNSDLQKYLSFYNDTFKRYDGLDKRNFSKMKELIFSRKEKKSIEFSKINIYPYPNQEDKKLFHITFYEVYNTKNYKYRGNKELFFELKDKKMSILVEK